MPTPRSRPRWNASGPVMPPNRPSAWREMLAHEIKNPLAGITGAAQLLSMNLGGEEREMTDLIVEETRRILKLLEQVEEFGNLPPARAPRREHPRRARPRAALRRWALPRICGSYRGLRPVAAAHLGDPDQLLQVILNL
jgi:two-component system nitrogen regulation sensor histidine kinase GlnL